jgi:hypothetical protein
MPSSPNFHEVSQAFETLPEWLEWLEANPWSFSPHYCKAAADDINRMGMLNPFGGYFSPRDIHVDENNLRESIIAHGISSRVRSVIKLILDGNPPATLDVYAPESVTPLANVLRARFAGFVASEYLPTAIEKAKFRDTRHEDIQALSFPDSSFDLYVSCEVMEHIPDVPAALREAARILRPGGQFIATFPFQTKGASTVAKAEIRGGEIVHLTEPEYHGNPVDPQGSLVFSIPGWDILDLARTSGFETAEMVMMSSRHYGIIANSPSLIMRAVK